MVSGRPASTVNSPHRDRGRCSSMAASTLSSWAADRVVGVPPPIYRLRTARPASFKAAPVASTSRHRASTNGSTSGRHWSTAAEIKEQ